jgi:hypothetical protein
LRYIAGIFRGDFFSPPPFPVTAFFIFKLTLIALFFIAEWFGREAEHPLARLPWRKPLRRLCYYAILGCVLLFSGTPQNFIYFQF